MKSCCRRSSHTCTLWIVLAAVVAALTTLAVVAWKLRWLDKLCCCHKKARVSKPAFSCDLEEEADTIAEVVKNETDPIGE